MNVLGENARSWRKARKRAVSPIIATILLVAITVVLAAVLYVLISGLTHGPSSAPLGTNFSWGSPNNATGTTNTLGCSSGVGITTKFCYTIQIAGAGGGVSTSNVLLSLRNSGGATVAWPTAAGMVISLLSPTSSGVLASYCAAATQAVATGVPACASAGSWSAVSSFNGVFASGDTIVIAIAAQAAGNTGGLLGIAIEGVGQSGYSGVVTASAFS